MTIHICKPHDDVVEPSMRDCIVCKVEFYEKALRHIAGFTATEEYADNPGIHQAMPAHRKLMWCQEFAREALDGIDPTTGKKRVC